MILLALTDELFDTVPINNMLEAELALRKMRADLPAEIEKRFFLYEELSDADREAILKLAENVLEPLKKLKMNQTIVKGNARKPTHKIECS